MIAYPHERAIACRTVRRETRERNPGVPTPGDHTLLKSGAVAADASAEDRHEERR